MTLDEAKQIAVRNIDARGWVEIIIVCGLSAVIWVKSLPGDTQTNQWHSAPVAAEIQYIDREVIVPKRVIVYVEKAKAELDLPPEIQNNPDEHVLQGAKLAASDNPQQAVCTQNSSTGESALTFRTLPMPWLAAENVATVRMDYGFKNGVQNVRLSGTWDWIAIKDWDIGASGSIYGDSTSFVGLGASVKLW